jgi:hypothetical protein
MADRYTHRLELALATLEKADSRPVTYDDLEAAGVEQPAQTVYELEVAGEPIVHTPRGGSLDPPGGSDTHRRRPPWTARQRSRRG